MKKEVCPKYFQGHEGPILSAAIHPDGKTFATGGEDAILRLWDLDSGKSLKEWKNPDGPLLSLCFHPKEKQIAIGSEKSIFLYETQTAEIMEKISYPYWVNCLSFDCTGTYLAYGGYENSILLWNALEKKHTLLSGHKQEITCIAFHSKETILASGSNDRKIKVWDILKGECLWTGENHTLGITGLCFSKDGQKLVSSSFDGTIRIWDTYTGVNQSCLQNNQDWLTDCDFLSDSILVSASGVDVGIAKGSNAIFLWDIAKLHCIEKYYYHDFPITHIQVKQDIKRMVSCDMGGKIALWDFSVFLQNQIENNLEDDLPCILAIDDDEWIQRLVKAALKKEYYVITASNGKEGLHKAIEDKPDLIVLDIMMPEMDGWELLKRLRSKPEFDVIPIILLTAMDLPEDRVKGLKAGANDYMTKPFNSQELAARVQKLLTFKTQIEKNIEEKKFFFSSSSSILNGSLEQIRFPSILKFLETEKQNGMLLCSDENAALKIFFRNGNLLIPENEEEAKKIKASILYFLQNPKGIFHFWLSPVEEMAKNLFSVEKILAEISKSLS